MRIDKFLNTVNIVKRRTIAQDMIDNGLVSINNIKVKPSREVKINDILEIQFLDQKRKFLVLAIPTLKTIPKNTKELYIKEIKG